jgi:YD repeat-containing protein
VGRLTQLQDSSGTTSYQYDPYGHVIRKTQGLDSLQYSYDPSTGQLTQLTYPNNQVVSYAYAQGRISSINVNATPLLSNIQYQPFGVVKSWTFGNGATYSRSFDTDNRLASYPLGTASIRTLGYDTAGRLTGISDPVAPQTLGYDALNRLTSYATANANQGYQYDANGNRTRLVVGSSTYAYSINPASNQLQAVAGPTPQTYQYDATGNVTSDSLHSLVYDTRGRMVQANTTAYSLNALGQRTAKQNAAVTTRYLYDEAGHLLYETGATGSKDYLYLGDVPVAVLQ